MSKFRPSLTYMPGLDGLRAVAVLAVFLYHMGFLWAAGGFLGVESFFVLSGYLITSILLKEYAERGRLRLGNFWLRRARRLWPALWFLLLGTVVLARVWAPDAWPRLRADLPAGFTYTTNILYILRKVPYFERVGRPPLLQHLWSLAVEEQFYLFWPLTLWGLLLLLRVKPNERGSFRLAAAVGGLAVLSAVWMALLFTPQGDPMRLYYGTDTRAAGFLLGGALAVLWPPGGKERYRRVAEVAGWLGLALLLFLYYRLDEFQDFLYRGGFFLTSAATAAAVLAASSPRTLFSKVLGHPIPRWIGTRSYAIYLWHWPFIAVFRPRFECSWPLGLCALAEWLAACLLAEISYRLVEHPIRSMGFKAWGKMVWQKGRGWGTSAAVLALAVGVFWLVSSLNRISAQAAPSKLEQALAAESTLAVTAPASTPTQTPSPTPTRLPELTGTPSPKSTTLTAAATPSPTISPTPTGLRLTLLGDSIMLSTLPTWRKTLPKGTFYMDAAQGRRFLYLLTAVPRLAAQKHLAPIVVVHLGTNGSFTDATFDKVMSLFLEHGVREVYFVNVRSPIRWAPLANRQLERGCSRWKEAHLLDWNSYATPHRDWFYEDFAHPNPTGAKAYVEFILRGIGWKK